MNRTFEHHMGRLLVDVMPKFFKREVLEARHQVSQAFVNYYRTEGLERGSVVARARYDSSAKYDLDVKEIARLEVTFLIAVLKNTVASAF